MYIYSSDVKFNTFYTKKPERTLWCHFVKVIGRHTEEVPNNMLVFKKYIIFFV